MDIAKVTTTTLAAVTLLLCSPTFAQDTSYKPGTVWNFSNIKIEPGQFENYMDFLSKTWKKGNEWSKKEGYIVSYHVFQVNNAREGEPDLILAIESKDYLSNAQQLEIQKKFEAFMAMDQRKMDTAAGERKVMRKLSGGMELQELMLK